MKYFVQEEQRRDSHSSRYLEFQAGRYHGRCWLDSSISIRDETWEEYHVSDLILEVVPEFDLYGTTIITEDRWDRIVEQSRKDGCACQEIIAEAVPWAAHCFETNDAFTILGI